MMKAEMYKVGSIGKGYFAIMARPSLDPDEPASIANIALIGINMVVSLLEIGEARLLGLDGERELVKAHGMDFVSFPIPDMGLPASVNEFASLSKMLLRQVDGGVNTLIHCHAGIGRSGLLAAGILLHCDLDPRQAFAHVSKMRGVRVPETPEQEYWLLSNQATIIGTTKPDQ